MFETMTFEYLLEQMLGRLPNILDKREGSIIYDALAPAAAEMAQMYISLDMVIHETFADTSSREYLTLRAWERGIKPYAPKNAIAKGVFNVAVDIGSRFNMGAFNYMVTELISNTDHSYKMLCETSGAEPNYYIGTLTPIEYIQGLQTATLTEILILGEDTERTEDLRQRYLSSFDSQAFGGNRTDYIQKANAIQGVGGVKVYRAWNGGGTVKLVIIDSEFKKPTPQLVAQVQTVIDPTVNAGDGVGIAPIDHVVTVAAANEQLINIESIITYAAGWSFTEIQVYINSVLDKYFSQLNKNWQNNGNIIVRISQIESRLLELEGIIDIGNTKINAVASNFVADKDSIVKRGTVSG